MKAKELFTRKILAQFTCQSVKLDWVEEKNVQLSSQNSIDLWKQPE